MRPFYVYDRWGKQAGAIAHPLSAKHLDRLNGEDSLTLDLVGTPLQKGDRIVWQDKFGKWHEHAVADTTEEHKGGRIVQTTYCENSIAELLTDYLVEVEPRGVVASDALSRVLEASGSRWEAGRVEPKGTESFSWYHENAYEAVTDIVEAYAGELQTSIELSGPNVTARRIDILARRGADYGRVFTYGRDLVGIERSVSSDPIYTALYGYGKGVQTYDEETGEATGGYSRKITFGEVNGGVDWTGDDDARLKYGVPDGKGGVKHAFGQVEFSDCEDEQELLELTKAELETASKPKVTYKGSVLDFGAAGFANGEDCQTGDTIYLRDRELDVRLQGRVLEIERDLLDEKNTNLTLGNIRETFTQRFGSAYADLDWLKSQADRWSGAADLPESYIDAVVARLNTLMNTTGGFTYIEAGNGIVTYDKPRNANPTMAIQIMGAGFRIANSKNSDGTWNWRTFGTGEGFTADLINAGTIKGGSNTWNLETGDLEFTQGVIHNADDSNYWNLSTGELRLASTGVKVDGNKTLGSYVSDTASSAANSAVSDQLSAYVPKRDFDRYLTFENTFNALTHDGADQGFFIQGGKAYVNASYVRTGIIVGGDRAVHGQTQWDLDQGFIQNAVESRIYGQTHTNVARMGDGYFQIQMDVTTLGDWTTATLSDSPSTHFTTFRAYGGMIWGIPNTSYVGYRGTTGSMGSLSSFYELARDESVGFLASVSASGGKATFTRRTAHFRQGWLCEVSDSGTYDVTFG